ncbi:MAG TPA: hypothetical protein VFO25_02335 [Candidatus Eremiobacteraceae bacterium]|nr:hypothetical protein [Candidatus Eremiobacteraceae bacterium]
MLRWLVILVVVIVAVVLLWRPAASWWCLDVGNLAYMRGDRATAAADFVQGLRFEPTWRALLEDHGRAVLDAEPAVALADFKAADCGEPCTAEAGDAESRLGNFDNAINDYLAAHAVERVGGAVDRLASEARYDDAIELERALASRLGTGMLSQADVASADYLIGGLDNRAARAARESAKAAAYHADAIRSFRRASQLAPFNEGYLLSLGFAESAWGDKRKARVAFEKVLDLHPHQSDAERGLAQLGVRNNDPN